MSLLFRGMSSRKGTYNEATVKQSLINQLSAAVKDLQIDQSDEYLLDTEFKEATNALCTILEAMFLHGLKDSFLRQVTLAVRSDIDDRPEPDFWAPLLVVSHRNVIDQISKLTLVTTDIGRSRAWIRLALNEGLMSRYFETIRREGQRALRQYYRPGALLRDTELLDVAQRLLEGVEAVPLNLPFNSSLFDTWTQQPLLLAGLWTPPLRATALKQSIATGIEVGEVLDREDRESASDVKSVKSFSSLTCVNLEQMSLKEEDALKIILGTPVYETPIAAQERAEQSLRGNEGVVDDRPVQSQTPEVPTQAESVITTTPLKQDNACPDPANAESEDSGRGNSLSGRLGWSSSFDEKDVESDAKKKTEETSDGKNLLRRQPGRKLQSFHSLLESYYGGASSSNGPDLEDFLQHFEEPESSSLQDPETSRQANLSYPHDMGFEVIDGLAAILENPEYEFLLQHVIKLPLEKGLDSQKYECFGCTQAIGLNFLPAKVCGLSGRYFCKDCTSLPSEEWVVPSRIIHNWDFRRISVSKQAARFLDDIQHHPLFDIKSSNPRLYLAVREMNQLQILRNQLNLLCAYLSTCRDNMMKELQRMVWPREYLYEHVHLYSLADLLEIPTGSLAQLLKKVIQFARGHVVSCWLCSQKGFFCEVCYKSSKNQKIIYPFDTNTTYRCPGCSAVFHATCLDATKPCPKCDRLRRRENESSLDEVCAF